MPMLCMLYKDMHYGYLVKKICFNLCVHICSRNTGRSPSHCLLEFATICVGGPVHFLHHHTPHDGYKQFWFLVHHWSRLARPWLINLKTYLCAIALA